MITLSNVTQHGHSKESDVIKPFSMFCYDAQLEDIVAYGEHEINTIVKWYRQLLRNNGCDNKAVQREW